LATVLTFKLRKDSRESDQSDEENASEERDIIQVKSPPSKRIKLANPSREINGFYTTPPNSLGIHPLLSDGVLDVNSDLSTEAIVQ
jgi:hypothetical protein